MEISSFRIFPRISPFITLLLSFATLGLYVLYWLYTRTQTLNKLAFNKPIPGFFVALCMASFIAYIYMAFQIPEIISSSANLQSISSYPELLMKLQTAPEMERFWQIAGLANLMQIIWAITFCHRLNHSSKSQLGDKTYCSYFVLFMTIFFYMNVFYLQYKINQLIDHNISNEDTTIGIM